MKVPRVLAVFFCAAGAALALALGKALLTSGLDRLPPAKVLVFAASMFGAVAAMLDWALFRRGSQRISSEARPPGKNRPQFAASMADEVPKAVAKNEPSPPPETSGSETASIPVHARLGSIVFREIFPPSAAAPGLSFYGGAPIGPARFNWPRARTKPGNAPLSFLMQWDCAELAARDTTGLLPRDGVLYLFCDLNWGDPFEFQFIHTPGPVADPEALPIPPDLPPVYGDEGAYQVPYCSPQIASADQALPRLLPKWPFAPIAFSYPVLAGDRDAETAEAVFWNDSEAVAEALLRVQHPEGLPEPRRRDERQALPFGRPFAAFPQDHAAVRVVSAKVLHELRRPANRLLGDLGQHEREARFKLWRDEAAQLYASAAAHSPASRVEPSLSDDIWRWIERLEPVLAPGWGRVVEDCANVSLGLQSEGTGTLPANLVAACGDRHRLALAYLRDELESDGLAGWSLRKARGALEKVRSVHAPSPIHMFGPPSFVQGHVEEYLDQFVLLLEVSSQQPVGINLGEGVLQFMIRPADLRERRWDQVKLVASAY